MNRNNYRLLLDIAAFTLRAEAGLLVLNRENENRVAADYFEEKENSYKLNPVIEVLSNPAVDLKFISSARQFNNNFKFESLKLKHLISVEDNYGEKELFVLLFSFTGKTKKNVSKPNEEIVSSWISELWSELSSLQSGETELLLKTVNRVEAIIYSYSVKKKKFKFITGDLERLTNLKKNELYENPLKSFRVIAPPEFSKVKPYVQSLFGGVKGRLEVKITDKYGNEKWIENYSIPVFENGRVVSIDGRIHDITNEYNNRLLLQRSESKLRSIFETADDLIFILDGNGNFTSVNSSGALLLEYIPAEMIGRHIMDFVPNNLKSQIALSFAEILKKETSKKCEWTFLSKLGKKILLEMRVQPVYEKNVMVGVVGFGRDISYFEENRDKIDELNGKLIEANRLIALERDRARHKISVLEELNRLKNEFVSSISHELRTPLASIIGFAETIESDKDMPESMRSEFNSIILNEAKRLANLINDVLDISKIERGSITLNKTKFNLAEVLDPVIKIFNKKANEKSIFFSYELPNEEVMILGDKERIEQIFENIIDNAVKFTFEKGRIAVYARVMNKDVEIIVSDTGAGIPKKDLPFIFQKFYKVNRPGTETPGTGLGLAIAKQIVDLHKGFITIISEEKQGTTVVIKLPKL